MKLQTLSALATGAALLGAPAAAQQHTDHSKMQHGSAAPAARGGATSHGAMAHQEDMQMMQRMHQVMMDKQDADPDRAFALKMIEHHRMAIAMAQTVQKHGDDAETKRMAQKMVDQQRKEIAELEAWLDKRGGRTPRP